MAGSNLVALVTRMPDLAEWQRGIDDEKFLVPLVLTIPQPAGTSGSMLATLGGEPVSFVWNDLPLDTAGPAETRHKSIRQVVSTPGAGELKSCAAGGMALVGYVSRGLGGFLAEDGEIIYGARPLKQRLDAMLAAAFGKQPDYERRYPADKQDSRGQMTIRATRAQ